MVALSEGSGPGIHAHAVGTAEDVRALKKARKEGKLAEAMLDRRMKLKTGGVVMVLGAVFEESKGVKGSAISDGGAFRGKRTGS
jgi:hypothetical protein